MGRRAEKSLLDIIFLPHDKEQLFHCNGKDRFRLKKKQYRGKRMKSCCMVAHRFAKKGQICEIETYVVTQMYDNFFLGLTDLDSAPHYGITSFKDH